jgi:hypothetical protein
MKHMPNAQSWSVISAPPSNRIILGVDFPAAGRREAGFTELVAGMGSAWSEYGFLQTVPPTVGLADRPTGDYYTEHWMRAGDWEQYEVVAVFGYCVGSVYAAEIARRLTGTQSTAPKVVLFDPQLTDVQLLANEMHKMIAMAGPVFSEEEAEQGRRRATAIVEGTSAVLAEAAVEIVDLYRELATIAFQRIGLSDNRRDEVVRLFESYMTWLSAAAQVDPGDVWQRSVGITSDDFATQEQAGDPMVVDAVKVLGRRFPLSLGHADLMRDEAAVRVLVDDLGL